jgi:hypothetical protein
MQDIDQVLVEIACTRAITGYCVAADRHDLAGFLNVFTADGVWERPGKGPLRGHGEIAAFFQQRPKDVTTCHVSSNVLIEIIDSSTARGTSLATVYRCDGNANSELANISPTSIIQYSDEFRRDEDAQWRISSRTTRTIFRAES